MNFLSLFDRLGKQTGAMNRQRVSACLSVKDLKELCENKPDWETVTIPLTLKFSFVKGESQKMYFIHDKKKR